MRRRTVKRRIVAQNAARRRAQERVVCKRTAILAQARTSEERESAFQGFVEILGFLSENPQAPKWLRPDRRRRYALLHRVILVLQYPDFTEWSERHLGLLSALLMHIYSRLQRRCRSVRKHLSSLIWMINEELNSRDGLILEVLAPEKQVFLQWEIILEENPVSLRDCLLDMVGGAVQASREFAALLLLQQYDKLFESPEQAIEVDPAIQIFPAHLRSDEEILRLLALVGRVGKDICELKNWEPERAWLGQTVASLVAGRRDNAEIAEAGCNALRAINAS